MLSIGAEAPDFEAETTAGRRVHLAKLRGRWVVRFFFPKAFTPGCTVETRRFQQRLPELRSFDVEVLGVSGDSHERQCDFAASLDVEFPMIGDRGGAIAKRYQAKRPLLNLDRRITYVIDPEGKIALAFQDETHMSHDERVVQFLQARKAATPPTPPTPTPTPSTSA